MTTLIACPDCDLLLNPSPAIIGDKIHCPRCNYLLQRPRANSIERSFALSITGLFLIIPANYLPLMGIKLVGNSKDSTLWSGVTSLFSEDLWGVALLVFLASMLFPLINILLSLFISAHLYFNRTNTYLAKALRCLQHLTEWAMLEVYLLGIIVACVKLSSMAELKFDWGLVAFIALLIINVLLISNLDESLFWQRIKQQHE
ncbi:MAG: paraquat-inducible protein A [Methylococcaceae bacterium]